MTEKEALIAIAAFVPFGPVRIKLLLQYFGSARKIWSAKPEKLHELGLSGKLFEDFINHRKNFGFTSYFHSMKKFGVEVTTRGEKNYPKRLKEIEDAPILIYKKGELKPQDDVCLGIVGSRKITNYGKEMAQKFASDLALSGVTIVSGLALGVDSVAHRAALDVGGRTIAVLGNGLDTVYPPTHKQLAQDIVKNGALISEYPLFYPAYPVNFPNRNRIISGISLGILVIEGTEKSGTLLTAKHAANQGREVFAIPGPLTSINSGAPHILIKQGAKLVTSAADILEELEIGHRVKGVVASVVLPETKEEELILAILNSEPVHIDEILRQVNMPAGVILSTITTMELRGLVKNTGSNFYQKANL